MSLLSRTTPSKIWARATYNLDPYRNRFAKGKLREELMSLPYQAEANEGDVLVDGELPLEVSAAPQTIQFCQKAMVRHPLTGKNIGRILLSEENENGSILHFQLVRGEFKSAWAKGELLLACPLNGPAKYIKILAYPPDDCQTGILRIES